MVVQFSLSYSARNIGQIRIVIGSDIVILGVSLINSLLHVRKLISQMH